MTLRALRYTSHGGGDGPVRCRIDAQSAAALTASTARPRPAAYVLPNATIAQLSRSESLKAGIRDRGTKHPRKQLAALMLGFERIPMIRGSYRAPGQLARSVRALLRRAGEAGERRVYLIGADEELFESIWTTAHDPLGDPPSARTGDSDAETSALAILERLPSLDVPPELEQRYVGASPSVQLVRQLIMLASKSDEPVLILGETGTGKEVVARSIHDYGPRRSRPFIALNCGAIPSELLESELFGHLPGSFTGAVGRRTGLWQLAHRGTLFLDEIGDLRLDHQAKILRALQQGAIRPVGGSHETDVDVRIIAATNRQLYAMVRAGEYRDDLYYRLRSFLIRTPALCEHPSDVPDLAEHFWRKLVGEARSALTAALLDELRIASWPGNARELRSVLAHLHAVFPDSDPSVEQLRTVYQLQGQALRAPVPRGTTQKLRRLRRREAILRLEEFVRACRVTLGPLERRAAGPALERVADALRRRLDELRRLLHGSADGGPASRLPGRSLDALRRLRRDLVRIAAELDVDPAAARRSWRREVRARLDEVLATIEHELATVDRS